MIRTFSITKKTPEYFSYTHYQLPSEEQLVEIQDCDCSADEIVNGYVYSIVGRGISSHESWKIIISGIESLVDKYPTDTNINALELAKTEYNNYINR